MTPVLLLTVAVFGFAMLIMSVGVIFTGRCLRGSCGGPDILDPNGDPLTCATCPNRQDEDDDTDRAPARREAGEGALPVLGS